ncbi:hypothetical protein IWX47DRAFT_548166 [Phyllosticta citricarpa]
MPGARWLSPRLRSGTTVTYTKRVPQREKKRRQTRWRGLPWTRRSNSSSLTVQARKGAILRDDGLPLFSHSCLYPLTSVPLPPPVSSHPHYLVCTTSLTFYENFLVLFLACICVSSASASSAIYLYTYLSYSTIVFILQCIFLDTASLRPT